MTQNKQAPLDVILTSVLMIVLLVFGFILVRKKNGAARVAGIGLLSILFVNVLHTSNFWLGYVTTANNFVTNEFTKLQKWKQQTGA